MQILPPEGLYGLQNILGRQIVLALSEQDREQDKEASKEAPEIIKNKWSGSGVGSFPCIGSCRYQFAVHHPGRKNLNLKFTRAKLEQLVGNLIKRTSGPCRKALSDAKRNMGDVLLVGGMSRMSTVQDIFAHQLSRAMNLDEAVAVVEFGLI